MRQFWARASVAAAGAILAGMAPANAQVTPQVVNGLPGVGEPTTAALVQGDAATGYAVCSAVLIGCDSAITTAHCFNSSPELKTTLFFQHAGFVPIESATRHPAYVDAIINKPPNVFDILRVEDISFVKLAAPVSGITPSTPIDGPAPPPGTPGRIVGFGRDPVTELSSLNPSAGIKRAGAMELGDCTGTLAGFDILCWEPSTTPGDPGEDVSTCNVDSGGPLFVDEPWGRIIAGITKGAVFDSQGQPDLCLPPVHPYDTSVARHRAWIDSMVISTGAIDLATRECDALPQFPENASPTWCDGAPWAPVSAPRTCGFQGTLGGGFPTSVQHVFQVPPETVLLRVALNGIATNLGDVNTDFYVRAGAPATTTLYDCAAASIGNLGFCEFPNPAAGSWYVLVDQVLGSGEYQVTASLFAPWPPPVPGAGGWILLAALLAAAAWRGLADRRRARGSRAVAASRRSSTEARCRG